MYTNSIPCVSEWPTSIVLENYLLLTKGTQMHTVQHRQDMITCRRDGLLSESPRRELLQKLRRSYNQSIMVPRIVPSWGRCPPCRGIAQLPAYIGKGRTQAPRRCFSMNPTLRQQTASSAPFNTPQSLKRNNSTL